MLMLLRSNLDQICFLPIYWISAKCLSLIKSLIDLDVISLSNESVNPSPFSRIGVAVTPSILASGYFFNKS